MQRKILWNKPILRKKLGNADVIGIPKANTKKCSGIQIGLQLKYNSCRPQQVVEHT